MTGIRTARGVAAAALLAAIGSAAPAGAATWPAPPFDGGDSASPAPAPVADHGDHGTSSGDAGHDDHGTSSRGESHEDQRTAEEHGSDTDAGGGHETGNVEEPVTVSDSTKARVLSGFGVANAAAVGGAILLRRRDRRSDRSRMRRAGRRGRTVR